MDISNPGLAYNKVVFRQLKDENIYKTDTKALNVALRNRILSEAEVCPLRVESDIGNTIVNGRSRTLQQFESKVAWPGMLMGLGYGHRTGTGVGPNDHPDQGETQTGFYFDHTTGLPVLPGSTVKGILRSYFPNRFKNDEQKRACVHERLQTILNELKIQVTSIEELEKIIFDGTENGNSIPSTQQDVFFEAVPVKGTTAQVMDGNLSETKEGVFLGEDVLTPHPHPLKDPVPIKLLKVLPGVTFSFQFLLNDKGIAAKQKKQLFEHLILNFGAGARKSVGFGQFESNKESTPSNNPDWYLKMTDVHTSPTDYSPPKKIEELPTDIKDIQNPKPRMEIIARITDPIQRKAEVRAKGKTYIVNLGGGTNFPSAGTLIYATIGSVNKSGVIMDISFRKAIS